MSNPLFQVDLNIQKTDNGIIECNNFNRNFIMNSTSIGLSCYEVVCSPRKILNETELSFNPNQIERAVKEILRCAICYEIYNDPVNIKTCLHKFCKKCIEDYNRKIKKECAICRHSIETRRLMKEDLKIKQIIGCMIPDIEKFKQDEDKEITQSIPNCMFKDEEKRKHQNEKAHKIEEISMHDNKSTIIINKNSVSLNQEFQLGQNEDNNNNTNNGGNVIEDNIAKGKDGNEGTSTSFLNKKKVRNYNLNPVNEGTEIEVKINCDENGESLKKYFLKTKLSLQDTFTLEFISKFICYKQNFPHEYLNKIQFYTKDNSEEKTFWEQRDSIKKIKDNLTPTELGNKLTIFFLIKNE